MTYKTQHATPSNVATSWLRLLALLIMQLSTGSLFAFFTNHTDLAATSELSEVVQQAKDFISKGQYDLADSIYAIVEGQITPADEKLRNEILHGRAMIHYNIGNYEQAETVLDSLVGMIQTDDDEAFLADVLKLRGNVQVYLGQYALAYQNQLKSLEYYQEANNEKQLASTYFSIGNNFFYQKQYNLALVEFEKAAEYWEKLENKKGKFFALGAIGSVHEHLGNLKEAIAFSEQALELAIQLELPEDIAWTTYNVGTIASTAGEMEKALDYLNRAKEMAIKTDNTPLLGYVLEGLTVTNMNQKNFQAALATLDESYSIAKKNKDVANLPGLYRLYSDIHFELDNNKKGREYIQRYVTLKDSLQTEELSSSIHNLKKDFELRELGRQKQIELLKKDAELKSSKTLLWVAGFATVAMLFMFLFVFVKVKSKHDKEKNELLVSTNARILKQNEVLKSSNRDLNQYAYIISHDLKEPLRNIGGFTSLLKRRMGKLMDDDAVQYMDYISRGVVQMNDLLSDLLEYSKIRKKSTPNLIDAEQTVKNVVESIALKIESSQAEMIINPLPKIYMGQNQFFQVMLNLISNGLKFVKDKKPKIEISCSANEEDYVFSVKDNGIGVDKEFQDKIFVVFQRLHHRGEYSGSGIGLSTCKKIVNNYGGEIWIESTPGEGATFFFSIPKSPIASSDLDAEPQEMEILDAAQAN